MVGVPQNKCATLKIHFFCILHVGMQSVKGHLCIKDTQAWFLGVNLALK